MSESRPHPDTPERQFAVNVVSRLREAGYEALWAGGCVRDELLGITPKDFDVATTATPQQVIELFGTRKTVPVGVSFGVVIVLGPSRQCGQIEVATFRADGEYLDGRRPSEVQFCSAEEDARRRDFTINGMFYDPVSQSVIDYVGGREDLEKQIVRAIGDPTARFTEDKLRMLRAVRFAATYRFTLESATGEAVRSLATEISQVSMERITQELRRMLAHETRAVSVANLVAVGLFAQLFPGVDCSSIQLQPAFNSLQSILKSLSGNRFEPAFAAVLSLTNLNRLNERTNTHDVAAECKRFKMSNDELQCITWLMTSAADCTGAGLRPLHVIKPIVVDNRFPLLLDLLQAIEEHHPDADFLRQYRAQTSDEVLAPEALIGGQALKNMGVEPGPEFKRILTAIRNEQLDEQLHTKADAISRAKELQHSAAE